MHGVQWDAMIRESQHLQMNRLSLRNNRPKFKTARKLPIILEESIEYIQFNKGKPEAIDILLLGLANTMISTDYAQKSPDHWWDYFPLKYCSTFEYPFVLVFGVLRALKASPP